MSTRETNEKYETPKKEALRQLLESELRNLPCVDENKVHVRIGEIEKSLGVIKRS